MPVTNRTIECPHCGHHLHVELDSSNGDQDYYEDCANCCNPVHLNMHIDYSANTLDLIVSADDEQVY